MVHALPRGEIRTRMAATAGTSLVATGRRRWGSAGAGARLPAGGPAAKRPCWWHHQGVAELAGTESVVEPAGGV